jgi:hypothetical protein
MSLVLTINILVEALDLSLRPLEPWKKGKLHIMHHIYCPSSSTHSLPKVQPESEKL